MKGCYVRTFTRLPLLLPPPPRCRPRSSVPGSMLPRDAACTRRAASASARAPRRQGSTWSAFGKLRRRPTALHRGPAGLGNAGQAASSASARPRGPRTVKSLCGASPFYRCFTVGGAVTERAMGCVSGVCDKTRPFCNKPHRILGTSRRPPFPELCLYPQTTFL